VENKVENISNLIKKNKKTTEHNRLLKNKYVHRKAIKIVKSMESH